MCEFMGEVEGGLVSNQCIQEAIQKIGGELNSTVSVEEVCFWAHNPDAYPDNLKKNGFFLWQSYSAKRSCQRILYAWWHEGQVYRCWLGIGDLINGWLPPIFYQPELVAQALQTKNVLLKTPY